VCLSSACPKSLEIFLYNQSINQSNPLAEIGVTLLWQNGRDTRRDGRNARSCFFVVGCLNQLLSVKLKELKGINQTNYVDNGWFTERRSIALYSLTNEGPLCR